MTDFACSSAINPRYRNWLTRHLPREHQPPHLSLRRTCRSVKRRFPVTLAGRKVATVSLSDPSAKHKESAMHRTSFNQRCGHTSLCASAEQEYTFRIVALHTTASTSFTNRLLCKLLHCCCILLPSTLRVSILLTCRDWASGYSNCKMQPDGYWIDVKGTLPPELTGTYYRQVYYMKSCRDIMKVQCQTSTSHCHRSAVFIVPTSVARCISTDCSSSCLSHVQPCH